MSEHNCPCPVCDSLDTVQTVERDRLPAMQNYVYRDKQLAQAVSPGKFSLKICQQCGFAFNGLFAPELLTYDRGYDNSVPAVAMRDYYSQLAEYLNSTYLNDAGLIVDVGCGKGTFLQVLCEKFPRIKALGIDPSYEGPLEFNNGRLRFIREFFSDGQLTEKPSLVICRHVLEHIQQPVEFMISLRKALSAFADVPLFVEVPDISWIVQKQVYWDFCYEHCNYFMASSLAEAANRAGLDVQRVQTAFGDQYLWLEGVFPASDNGISQGVTESGEQLANQVTQYVQHEQALMDMARTQIAAYKRRGYHIVVWGMATKGTLFSYLVDPQGTLIDQRIDINANKHGCFTPIVGHRIDSPRTLADHAGKPTLVIVMNENYGREILSACHNLGIQPLLINANCQPLVPVAKAG